MLTSRDLAANAVEKFGEALSGPKHIETIGDQVLTPGWLRGGDVEDERVRVGVRGGYAGSVGFLS